MFLNHDSERGQVRQVGEWMGRLDVCEVLLVGGELWKVLEWAGCGALCVCVCQVV